MTEAYAIKEGEKFVAYGNTENDAWGALLLARPHVPFDADRQRFHCVPVVVSEFEEPLSPELAKKYPLDRRLRIFIEQLMLADDVAKEFDYEEAKRLHRELVDRLTAVSEKGEAEALLREAGALLNRYRKETPLGNQPHMIAEQAVDSIQRIDAHLSRRQG